MTEKIPAWVNVFAAIHQACIYEFPGRRWIKFAWAVNFHKIITGFIILGLMIHYDNFTTGAWVYLALHGTYGLCWLIKDFGFRDHKLEIYLSTGGTINLYLLLIAWYWVIPFLFISRFIEPTGFELFLAITVHTLGVVLMIAADGQRHFSLKYRKGLITTGVFRYTRNANYLGEIMLYSAYAYLSQHWISWLIIAVAAISTFFPNMYVKDASISRHPGWSEYKDRSSLLIPWKILTGRAFVDRLYGRDASVEMKESQ